MTESRTHQRPADEAAPTPFWLQPIPPAAQVSPVEHVKHVEPASPGPADEQGEPIAAADEPADEAADEAQAPAEDPEEDSGEQPEEEPDEVSRFEELVEERVRRARYAHHLTRAVLTPEESATAVIVERRAAVWVPTMTLLVTVASAVAAIVLATRLRSDPSDPGGNQPLVVTITVCLLAAAFATLLRAELHYARLRPRGRLVRHDVADAYELVRDAPRRLVRKGAPVPVLKRVAELLPAAEQLVDLLSAYTAGGGAQVRLHPAYERIIRMRAEVEALEVLLAEQQRAQVAAGAGASGPAGPAGTAAALPDLAGLHEAAAHGAAELPAPDQVPDFEGLGDLATDIIGKN